MMTPRGVADVQVYTPERVEARYGIRPDQIPDFIGLKGDTCDNIPGIPGIGDKTAGQLIAQYGSLEAVIEHAAELSPARAQDHHRARRAGARLQAARDDAARPRPRLSTRPGSCSQPPDRVRAEGDLPALRVPGLLGRVDTLDEARAARRRVAGRRARRFRGARASSRSWAASSAIAVDGDR